MLHQEMKYLLEIITSNVKILLLLWFMLNYTCRTDGLRIRVLIILCDETSQPNQDNVVNHDFYFLLVFWWMIEF